MKKALYFILILVTQITFSQSFEGRVTYKTTMENPYPDMFTDSVFKEKILKPVFGDQGFMLQTYYYKGDQYMSEIATGLENGFEVYVPNKKKLYAWKANSTEAVVHKTDVHSDLDAFVELIETKEIDTILNIPCKKILLKSKMGTGELWLNTDYLKVNAGDYADFKLNHKNIIFQKYGCLPFRTRMGTMTVEVIAIESMEVAIEKFELPKFESEIEP